MTMVDPAAGIYGDPTQQENYTPATGYDPTTAANGGYYLQNPDGSYQQFIPGQASVPEGTQLFTPSGSSPYTPPAAAPAAPAAPATPPPTTPTTSTPPPTNTALDQATATDIIDTVLAPWGIDVNATAPMPDGNTETLSQYLFNLITSQGLTDPTSIADMIQATVPQTPQFNAAFPGYKQAIAAGIVRTPTDYVSVSESLSAVMHNFGVPTSLITTANIGNLIAGGVSSNELTQRLQNGYNAYQNSPAEVQNYFNQEFGINGPMAAAMVWMTPASEGGQTYETLSKMLAGAQIGGAAQASNINISGGLAQRLADMGETYQSAQQKFRQMTAQEGLYQQTVGEANKVPVPGTQNASQPMNESTTGVAAAFGLSGNADQQLENEVLSRANAFKGTGRAASTTTEGFSGLAEAKPY